MAKRSPILGYNHNVRYRGLVFHVQTEDSGLLNPHLFTHLFHGGVIVSTRKLVYDSGANEEAIKSLMQAQHKAVMKDLRKGSFDDKIDQYLGGTEGLEPRAGGAAERASTEISPPPMDATPLEIVNDGLSEPIELPMKRGQSDGAPVEARTQTGDKTTPVTPKVAAAAKAEVGRAPTQLRNPIPEETPSRDSAPIIEMTVDEEDELAMQLRGAPRDTAVENVITPPSQRPPSHGAATLPKAAHRTPTPPVVTTRVAGRKDDSHAAPLPIEPTPDRPGQYSVNRKDSSSGAQMREKTGRIPALNPVSQQPKHKSGAVPIVPQPKQDSGAVRRVPNVPPQPQRPPTPATGSRVPPGRVHATAPIANRTPSPPPPAPGSGVVMTRPAVIVGAPPKAAAPQQRVRKAREDEGRGFGQGLISEKSLDEVILAYLSEDAEDK